MTHTNTEKIALVLTLSASLFFAGCGSEDSSTEAMHDGGHLENHTDEHSGAHENHDDMPQTHSSIEEGGHEHNGGHQGSDTMMKKPDDARLVTVTATNYEFSPAEISAKPGEKLFVKLINEGNAVHMWQLRDKPETHLHTPAGETAAKVVTAPERPGDYDIVCQTPGHEEHGMVGSLKVSE